jgi:hypothetical protein
VFENEKENWKRRNCKVRDNEKGREIEREHGREKKEGSISLFFHEYESALDIFDLLEDEDVIEGLFEQKLRLVED